MEYIVKALSVGGKNNKIYRAGETVSAGCFSTPIDTLISQGFIHCKDPGEKPSTDAPGNSISDAMAEAADVDSDDTDVDTDVDTDEHAASVSYNDITKGGILEELDKTDLIRNEDFKKNQSKQDLWDLWMGQLKK